MAASSLAGSTLVSAVIFDGGVVANCARMEVQSVQRLLEWGHMR
jgi:hypothetical protein